MLASSLSETVIKYFNIIFMSIYVLKGLFSSFFFNIFFTKLSITHLVIETQVKCKDLKRPVREKLFHEVECLFVIIKIGLWSRD